MTARFGFVPKRIAAAVPLIISVVLLVFLILKLTPGDPARLVVGLRASEEQLAQVRAELGLDQPVFVQFVDYLGGVLTGDFGYSYKSNQPVMAIIAERLPVSLWLLAIGALMSVAISLTVATLAARKPNGAFDHVSRATGVLFFAMPSFWVGILLILLVALPTGWFPVGGFGYTPAEQARALVLPALTLALAIAPLQIRSLRASLIQVRGAEFVTTARSLGIPPGRTARKFILRNAMVPTVSILALNIGYMLFGAVVIETTFALPGIGEGIVLAARSRDIPLIQGYTILFAVMVIVVFLVADIVNASLDPRVRVAS
jgi:peptide/nickel transport system permease protein